MGLDKKTEQLFHLVLEHADNFQKANQYLFLDLAHGLSYEVLGDGLGGELGKTFSTILEGLSLKDRDTLAQLRERAGKDTAAQALLNSILHYQMTMYVSRTG